MRLLACVLAAASSALACTSKVDPVDPAAFACFDDLPEDDELPCPESHWCDEGSCTPRLGCSVPGVASSGCDPARRCETAGEDCARCTFQLTARIAAVACEPAAAEVVRQTTTSTRPASSFACECPDGAACVTLAEGAAGDAYPLYLVPPGGALPTAALGLSGEVPDRRWCVRGCSAERDCGAGHTCRPALWPSAEVLEGKAIADRSTVGVCWPERLVTRTSTSMPVDPAAEVDPLACRKHSDCPPGGVEPCRFRVVQVPDHPAAPIGAAWGERRALSPRCSTEPTSLRNADDGCTTATECKSGLCIEGRCARPCDPATENLCPSNRACVDRPVERRLDGDATVVEDRAQICAP